VANLILVRTPARTGWQDTSTAAEFIDTWGSQNTDQAIATAQRLIEDHGEVGQEYEILEVRIVRRTLVRAQRVGIVQPNPHASTCPMFKPTPEEQLLRQLSSAANTDPAFMRAIDNRRVEILEALLSRGRYSSDDLTVTVNQHGHVYFEVKV
jgi:hypothetical protein